ncbi:MAG: glycosyltransferase family 39 protein [Oscillospiraceae bacterium]|jgi:hypothetical protein|nr:glycosyltransferase family 39 protein [Oscillospiraceae bacterium]
MGVWIIPTLITAAAAIIFAALGLTALSKRGRLTPALQTDGHLPYKVTSRSLVPLAVILAVSGTLSFWKLGSVQVPSSTAVFSPDEPVIIEMQSVPHSVSRILWYSAINTGTEYHVGEYTVSYSVDGDVWYPVTVWEQDYASIFKWRDSDVGPPYESRFIKIEASNPGTEIGEIFFLDEDGLRVPFTASNPALCDEQELPAIPSDWMYNSYFDEVYHPRTAVEHLRGITPYEITHPPLGKIIMSVGIRVFGINPLGWRVTGVIIGLLTIIPLYIFIQNLFGKTLVSASAATLYAFDFMRYVQTRLATVDTEAVFFILLMYYFMYRAIAEPDKSSFKKTIAWLALSGISFGLGAATKWIVIYGGLGLIALWIILAVKTGKSGQSSESARRAAIAEQTMIATGRKLPAIAKLIMFSVVFFIVVPLIIYLLSYIPYASAKYGASADGTFSGFLTMVRENQKYMLRYHTGLDSTHPYSSEWWQWVLNLRPILYYRNYLDGGAVSLFGTLASPLTAWAGLLSLVLVMLFGLRGKGGAIIAAGYFSQLLPWVIVPRIAFAYHYFPNIVFLILAISWVMDKLADGSRRSKLIIGGVTALGVALFALFFPALSGLPVSESYTDWLSWFGSYPF